MALDHFAQLAGSPAAWFRIVSAVEGNFSLQPSPGPGKVSNQPLLHGVKCIYEANGRRFEALANRDGRVVRWREL